MILPKRVKIVEVGPRDGLQHEKQVLDTALKIDFINQLSETGLSAIEVTSFVSPERIPALADHQVVFENIQKKEGVSYSALVPNLRGLEAALAAGVKEIAVFTSPSETFNQHNIQCSLDESKARIASVVQRALEQKRRVRAYLSCVLGCPYEGFIAFQKTLDLAAYCLTLGCSEISLGDTIGVGTPKQVVDLLQMLTEKIPVEKCAVHFHDTYGQALVNIYAALECGIRVVDSAVAGLGGCPYAKGASGNVATEEVVYLLQGLGIETGVDLKRLVAAGQFITKALDKAPESKVNIAFSQRL